MKIFFRLIKVFFISMLTLWIISSFPGLEFLYQVLGVTQDSTKEKIVAGISTIFIGFVFEFIPYIFKKYIADRITLSVMYLKNNKPITKMQFRKSKDNEGTEEYGNEIVKIVFSLDGGTSAAYWILNKLNTKVILKFNPEHFSTLKKDGSIIMSDDSDELLSRDMKGCICMSVFNGISSKGEYSMDTEINIKPNYAHMDKSNFEIKIQTGNWLSSILAKSCIKIVNNKLFLKRMEE